MKMNDNRLSVDRIESDFAVCYNEKGEKLDIELSELPENIKEGDWLKIIDKKYIIDNDTALERHKKILEIQKNLWE